MIIWLMYCSSYNATCLDTNYIITGVCNYYLYTLFQISMIDQPKANKLITSDLFDPGEILGLAYVNIA